MIEKSYFENVVDEILEMIKTNIHIHFNCNDEAFIGLREHCIKNYDSKYKNLDYSKLLFFTEEALAELINCHYLYDFRTLE